MSGAISTYGTDTTKEYQKYINNLDSISSQARTNIQNKNYQLLQKQQILVDQLKEIEDKEKLLLTRSRMLQISQDRNAFKKKIIYLLIAIIFLIFIFTLVMYIFYTRKMEAKV